MLSASLHTLVRLQIEIFEMSGEAASLNFDENPLSLNA